MIITIIITMIITINIKFRLQCNLIIFTEQWISIILFSYLINKT